MGRSHGDDPCFFCEQIILPVPRSLQQFERPNVLQFREQLPDAPVAALCYLNGFL